MNGRGDPTGHRFTAPEQHEPHQGRHRHAPGAGTWTPAVAATPRRRRRGEPDAVVTGSLPLPPPAAGTPEPPPSLDARDDAPTEEFIATNGELPVPVQPAGIGEQTTVRRRKVSLTDPPPSARPAEEDDEERVYLAPPDGLGKFDLGTVPASVTPPRSWRKAAWFASLSSGFVVVALLVAGTVLVGQPVDDRQAIGGWTDRHGGVAPTLPNEQYADDETLSADATASSTDPAASSRDDASSSASDPLSSPTGQMAAPPMGTGGGQGPSKTPGTPPTTTVEPKKPPVTPAPTTKAQGRYVFPTHDADEMGKVSQDFLNTVTEDPARAHAMTTGELAEEGAEGLRRKYDDVAYFEVKHVYIEPNEGYTINTVEVTHPDGSKTEETRKLVFGDDTKIADDGA